jgi:hypothetical protein
VTFAVVVASELQFIESVLRSRVKPNSFDDVSVHVRPMALVVVALADKVVGAVRVV